MTGVLIAVAAASFIALQASAVGAPRRIVVPAAAVAAGVMAAFWALAIETLFPGPNLWQRVPREMAENFALGAVFAALFVAGAGGLIAKIKAFKEKYPER